MITNPDTLRVLCFGDSNTRGAPSDDPEYVRLPANRRWTGLLQGLLGDRYDVVEEGLQLAHNGPGRGRESGHQWKDLLPALPPEP